MASSTPSEGEKLPDKFKQFIARYPELGEAHARIGQFCQQAGPLDRKTIELVKIGISIGAGLETATRSHVRQALRHGASESELEQIALLAYNTCGWPRMMMGWMWIQQQLDKHSSASTRQEQSPAQGDKETS